jgi:hypothetical protein
MKTLVSRMARNIALGCLLLACVAPAARGAEAEWTSLFNGKDLTGWTGVNDVTFEVKDGNLRLVKGMGWLRDEKEYGDFVLELEFRALDEKYDSGIYFRSGLEGKPWPDGGWQLNLRYDALAGLVKGYSPKVPSETPKIALNKWMKLHLVVKGRKATLDVDGERAWEYDGIDKERGYIGIQAENKSFDFRNIRIQSLASDAAAK